MTRREALLVLGIALGVLTGGLTWLLGGWGLIIGGVLLAVGVAFTDEVKGAPDGEAVAKPARSFGRHRESLPPG
jgi:hypothetical protein